MITRIEPVNTGFPVTQVRVLTLALQDESVITDEPATVQVQINEETVATVVAEVSWGLGADNRRYPAVKLRMKKEGEHDRT